MTFRVIPVIDLRGGLVVRARAGERDGYAPIVTPLARGSVPADVARGLLDACPADILYVADLDAIVDGRDPDVASLQAIADACPGVAVWVDAGFDEADRVRRFLKTDLGRPVIGSESQADERLLRDVASGGVLSLDTMGDARLGPQALHDEPGLWPEHVIVMTLGRIGIGEGPDLRAIERAVNLRPDVYIYAAGGVRGPDDIHALDAAGAAGALVASAIHDGRLGSKAADRVR